MRRKKDEKTEVPEKKGTQKRKKKKKEAKTKHTEHEVVTKEVCTFKLNKSPLRLFLESIGVILPDDISIVYTHKRKKED